MTDTGTGFDDAQNPAVPELADRNADASDVDGHHPRVGLAHPFCEQRLVRHSMRSDYVELQAWHPSLPGLMEPHRVARTVDPKRRP
jgi:hypothetical protein